MKEGLIIIPAHNEAENISKVLSDISALDLDLDILVINDGSKDDTRELVIKAGGIVISHPFNLGYGASLQTGFKYARQNNYKYVIQFDGDGQHDAKNIIAMKNEICKGEADIVSGSRFLGNTSQELGILKPIVMGLLRGIIKTTTGVMVTDPTCGFKALSKRTFEYYSIMKNYPPDYPDADVLIQMIKLGFKIKEIPVNVRERQHGESMHSGYKPILYLMKMIISINIVLLRNVIHKEIKI